MLLDISSNVEAWGESSCVSVAYPFSLCSATREQPLQRSPSWVIDTSPSVTLLIWSANSFNASVVPHKAFNADPPRRPPPRVVWQMLAENQERQHVTAWQVWRGALRRWNVHLSPAWPTPLRPPPWRRPGSLCKQAWSLANWAALWYTQQRACFSFRQLLSNYDNSLIKTNVNNNITLPFKDTNFQLPSHRYLSCFFSFAGSVPKAASSLLTPDCLHPPPNHSPYRHPNTHPDKYTAQVNQFTQIPLYPQCTPPSTSG